MTLAPLPPAAPLRLRRAGLADGRVVDIRVADGRITEVAPARPAPSFVTAPEDIDLSGYLVLPAPVEPHAHLDKAYTADLVSNPDGDLSGAVTAWLGYRPTMEPIGIAARARTAVRSYVGNGVTAIRTHVDVGDDLGLRSLAAITRVRQSVAGQCRVQIVAFASVPLTGVAGAGNRALLREAMAAGADVVGGCPARDPDPAGCIQVCLEVAGDLGAPVDLHIDEHLDPEPDTLSLLAEAVAGGFPYPVAASHCASLGMRDPVQARRIADRVAAAGIAVICLPQTNLYLQGRGHGAATPRGLTAIGPLRAAGVNVAAGGDNLQDPFNVLGRADPLETAALLVLAGHDRPEWAYAAVSTAARRALGLSEVEVAPGFPAELLAIRASTVREAVATAGPDRMVIHEGRVVARTETIRRFPMAHAVESLEVAR